MKVFVCDIYDRQAAELLKGLNADAILCNQLKEKAPEGMEILDANSERIAGYWEAWHSNEVVVTSLLNKAPGLRFHKGIDLLPAMLKTVLWANRKYGYLKAWLKKHPDAAPLTAIDLYPVRRARFMVKYLKTWIKARLTKNTVHHHPIPEQARVAFMVEDMFEWNILLPVARSIGSDKVCWILPPGAKFSKDELKKIGAEWRVWQAPSSPSLLLPLIPFYKLNRAEVFCLNAWMNDLSQISDALYWGELLFRSKIDVLVGLAQENTHIGHILSALAEKHGKSMVNTMNGIKTTEPNSARTSFSAWIVWDESMKKMLHEQVGVPEKQMVVSGSLQQDALANPHYSGSLPLTAHELEQHKVISVISAKDLRMDKVEALDTLYSWAKNHPDCIILYRPHPLEKVEYLYLPENPEFRFELIRPEISGHKQSLMDQLLMSDLVINFRSTVSIEAKWMGVPCITYEKKPESDLYCVDGKTLFHAANPDDLLHYLNIIRKKPSRQATDAVKDTIAADYARIILQFVKQ